MEILLISKKLRDLILQSANGEELKQAALSEGFQDLRENGFTRVREGVTTVEEVLRVTAGDN